MRKTRVGCIGAGGIARIVHLKGYDEHPNVEITAVCDTDLERAQTVADQFGIPKVFKRYQDLVKEDIDAVSVCTPNAFHAPASIAAMKAGKDVLCEKPMALNARQAENMLDVANQTGQILMLALNNRFEPGAAFIRSLVKKGTLGQIYSARAVWRRRWGVPGGWFRTKKLAGGGCLIDLGVHMIDVAMYMAGFPAPKSVTGATYSKFASVLGNGREPYDVDDAAYGFLRFPGGETMQVEITWVCHAAQRPDEIEVVLAGTKGGASLFPTKAFTMIDGRHVEISPVSLQGKPGHAAEIEHFVDCVRKRKKPATPGEVGVAIQKTLDALYRSSRLGREVALDEM